jgi:hypothetical protein
MILTTNRSRSAKPTLKPSPLSREREKGMPDEVAGYQTVVTHPDLLIG